MQAFDKLVEMIEDVKDDVKKADGGVKAAGTRVRTKMMDIARQAKAVKDASLEDHR